MKILFTSAIINDHYEQRKKEYIESFNTLLNYFSKQDIYIIECYSSERVDFLEDLNTVFYTKTDTALNNKGIKEVLALMSFIINAQYSIDDEEIVIKQSGRYKLLNDNFIKIINNTSYDAYIRLGDDLTFLQCFTGFFAIRFKYLKEFLFSLDLQTMENYMINLERELYVYLHNKNINKCICSSIGLHSNVNNESIVIW